MGFSLKPLRYVLEIRDQKGKLKRRITLEGDQVRVEDFPEQSDAAE